ncbi:MAG TPA: flagellar hook protein FlgE [Bryobacteraceae bacterium]|nr:flagellar hook protein FlgE [Bryobacteraceae bacterium]
MGSFSIALSGLTADSAALDIVGNNLANLNTTGFKDSTVSFYDLLQESVGGGAVQIGGGVSAPQSERQFTQGSIQLTGGAYDAAIQGNGFFIVGDSNNATLYTRAGNFQIDANGNLVTATGQFVQGWNAEDGVLNTSGAIGNITIPQNALQTPVPTTTMTMNLNLDSAGVVGEPSGSFSAPIQVVDSLGQTHTLTANFTMTGPGAWNYEVDIDGGDLAGGTAGTPTAVATGSVSFDSNGNLINPTAPGQVPVAITGLADGASDMNINWNLFNSNNDPTITQYAAPSAVSASNQNGIQPAEITQLSLANGGTLIANYSDGAQQTVGQIALAAISNPSSLVAVGQNNYEIGADTATPAVGTAGTGSRGTIEAGALEASTVDIATEFTNLIVYQNAYQANSKVIQTLDELTQALLEIKQ